MFTARPRVFFALVPILSLLVLCVQTSIIMELKSRVPESYLELLAPYYIPDGQCTGAVYNICPNSNALGLSVRLEDPKSDSFGELKLDSRLDSVLLFRSKENGGKCTGKAHVEVRVFCARLSNVTIDAFTPPTTLTVK